MKTKSKVVAFAVLTAAMIAVPATAANRAAPPPPAQTASQVVSELTDVNHELIDFPEHVVGATRATDDPTAPPMDRIVKLFEDPNRELVVGVSSPDNGELCLTLGHALDSLHEWTLATSCSPASQVSESGLVLNLRPLKGGSESLEFYLVDDDFASALTTQSLQMRGASGNVVERDLSVSEEPAVPGLRILEGSS